MTAAKYRVLWIDDDVGRDEDAKNLADKELQVDFLAPRNVEPTKLRSYDLLLVDYKLDKLKIEGRTVSLKAPAIAGLLRSVSDEIPAYMLSSETAAKRAKFAGLTWFEEDFDLAEVQDSTPMRARLKRDIAGYRSLRKIKKGKKAQASLLKLLRAPSGCELAAREAMPLSLRASWAGHVVDGQPKELLGVLGFARWVRRMLLQRPGPLLPALHAATRVGLDESRFLASTRFAACKYDGIFANPTAPRWWTGCLDQVLYAAQQARGLPTGAPFVVGPKVFNLSDHDLVRCAVCGDTLPEVVARDADDVKRMAAVHLRCSRPDGERDFTPFFDEERVFEEQG